MVTLALVGVMLVIGGLLVWSASLRNTTAANNVGTSSPGIAAQGDTAQPVTQLPPPPTCGYCVNNLVGKTTNEIGQYALKYAQNNQLVRSGAPQILLSRPITREEYTALGLGCLPEFAVFEQPPLDLVILKGDFDVNRFGGARAPLRQEPNETIYLGYVFDLWAGQPASWQTTKSGGVFRAALNDASLPLDGNEPSVCPPQLPTSQITLHYGNAAPGFDAPPPLPPDIQARQKPASTVASPVVPPTSSPVAPLPVSTPGSYPTLAPAP